MARKGRNQCEGRRGRSKLVNYGCRRLRYQSRSRAACRRRRDTAAPGRRRRAAISAGKRPRARRRRRGRRTRKMFGEGAADRKSGGGLLLVRRGVSRSRYTSLAQSRGGGLRGRARQAQSTQRRHPCCPCQPRLPLPRFFRQGTLLLNRIFSENKNKGNPRRGCTAGGALRGRAGLGRERM